MHAWRCSCGDQSAGRFPSRAAALVDADEHRTRAGRLRDYHATMAIVADDHGDVASA